MIENHELDFVFEEIAGLGPTVAEDVVEKKLGIGHYLDVDPPVELRPSLGIGICSSSYTYDPMTNADVPDSLAQQVVVYHGKREILWLEAIEAQPFKRGLLICGHAHLLSMAFRLELRGFAVEAQSYYPEHRLCGRKHEHELADPRGDRGLNRARAEVRYPGFD